MTYLELSYIDACQMPEPARTATIETLVRMDRWQRMRRMGHFHDKFSTCHMLNCEPYGGSDLWTRPTSPTQSS